LLASTARRPPRADLASTCVFLVKGSEMIPVSPKNDRPCRSERFHDDHCSPSSCCPPVTKMGRWIRLCGLALFFRVSAASGPPIDAGFWIRARRRQNRTGAPTPLRQGPSAFWPRRFFAHPDEPHRGRM